MIEQQADKQPAELSRLKVRTALRLWHVESPLGWLVGTLTTGTFPTGFAIALGCSNFLLGLMAGIPSVVGLLQLAAPAMMRRFPSRRIFVALFAGVGRFVWIPMMLIPFVVPRPAWAATFIFLTLVSFGLQSVPGAVWIDWLSDLVPPETRGQYFGIRNLYGGVTSLIVSIAAGFYFDYVTKHQHWSVFVASDLMFGIAMVASVGSLTCCLLSPDVPRRETKRVTVLASLKAPLSDSKFRSVLNYSFVTAFAQGVAGQFFLVYMMKELQLTYAAIQILSGLAAVITFVSQPMFGYLGDKYGNKPILVLSSILVILPPFLWCMTSPDLFPGLWGYPHGEFVLSQSKMIIIVLQILAGLGWSGVGICQFNLLVGSANAELRSSYIAANSALVGIVGGISPLIGGALLEALQSIHFHSAGLVRGPYHVLFVISGLTRFVMVYFALRLQDPLSRSTRYVVDQLKASPPVGSFAAIQRLEHGDNSDARRKAAAELGRLRSPLAVEELVKALDDVSLLVREQSAASLGVIGDPRAVKPLIAKLTDPGSGIAPEAAVALGKIGDRSALPALAAAIQLGGPVMRRLAAIEAVGRLSSEHAPDILIPLLADRDAPVRLSAVKSLTIVVAGSPTDRIVAAMIEQWDRESDPTVLPALAEALARANQPALAPRLLAAYDRVGSPIVKRELLNAVGSIVGGADSFYAYLVMDGNARDHAIVSMLNELGTRARKQAGSSRLRARLRSARDHYVANDPIAALLSLSKTEPYLVSRPTGNELLHVDRDHAIREILRLLGYRAQGGSTITPEEVLLAVFLIRLMHG